MQSGRSRACRGSTSEAEQQTPQAAAEPQDLAGTGSASLLMDPLPLPGGSKRVVGVEEGVPCGAAKQV